MRPGHSDGHGVADELLSRFQVGTSAHWPGAGVFWLIDARGRVRNGQVVLYATPGSIKMDPAFPCHGLHQERMHAPNGKQTIETPNDPGKDQFALEMDHLAECVHQNKTPCTPGEEGLQDQRIMEAIYLSAKENRPVKLPLVAKRDAFRGEAPKEEEA